MTYYNYSNAKEQKENMKLKAKMLTDMDQKLLAKYENFLNDCSIQSYKDFYERQLSKEIFPPFKSKLLPPQYDKAREPQYEQIKEEFSVPTYSIFEIFFKSLKKIRIKREQEALDAYHSRLKKYKEQFKKDEDTYKEAFDNEQEKYKLDSISFVENQKANNEKINSRIDAFLAGNTHEIEEFFRYVLDNSTIPINMDKVFDVQYMPENKTLIVSYYIPNSDTIPNVIQHKFVQTRMEIDTVKMPDKKFEKFYNYYVYMCCLRTLNELFRSDETNLLDTIVYNGWVKYIDKSTGKDSESCIITVETTKEKFLDINLCNVDSKECIKGLKGIFAPNILTLTPVIPYMNIDRNDSRFVEGKAVENIALDGFNLATMPWEDFEYFVRELFDKMFNVNGGEVKVTQASHDGGVDAIAFDDDPIRGGKFVIQAKRYNNVVPVSAVRDLYGTMIHEGATKGILVTTSFYGKESYDFSKDKPITLIDGQSLLGLLNKYGYKNLTIKINK